MIEEFEEYDGEIIKLSEEDSQKIVDALEKRKNPVQKKTARKPKREVLQEKIGFLMGLLGSGIPIKNGENTDFRFLISDEEVERMFLQKQIMDLTQQYLKS